MKKYFSIGETAKINHLSIQALRLYDKMGILKPAYVDKENSYRYYTIDQFMYIDLIKYSKQIGAPLKELKKILESKNLNTFLVFLEKQQKILEKEVVKLNNIKNAINHITDKIEYGIEFEIDKGIYLRELDKRFIINIPVDKDDENTDFEIKLRSMDKVVDENEIMFEGDLGYIIDYDIFITKGAINYKYIYSTLCVEKKENFIEEIPKGKYLCIAYLNDEREDAIDKIRKYMKENNIPAKGIVLESQLFNTIEHDDDLIYELQILI